MKKLTIFIGLLFIASIAWAAQVCFTASTADVTTIVNSFAITQDYDNTGGIPDPAWTPGGPTPIPTMTKAQFAQYQVRLNVLRNVIAARDIQARATAQAAFATTPTPALQ